MLVPFHTGIVTNDLRATMADMTGALGVHWSPPLEEAVTIWTPDGVVELVLQGAFSVSDQGRFELIGSVPGTIFDSGAGAIYHHVSFWSEDLAADSRSLVEKGFELAMVGGTDPAAPDLFAYHRQPGGGYVELLSAAERPMYAELWEKHAAGTLDGSGEPIVMRKVSG